MLMVTILIVLICLDQLSKILVFRLLSVSKSLTIISNFFYLSCTYNKGAAWSILEGKRFFLILITLIIIGFILFYLKKNRVDKKSELAAFALILGGAIGNLIDRLFRGYVIDFLDFRFWGYNFPVFNLADTFIVVGVFILFILSFRKGDEK